MTHQSSVTMLPNHWCANSWAIKFRTQNLKVEQCIDQILSF